MSRVWWGGQGFATGKNPPGIYVSTHGMFNHSTMAPTQSMQLLNYIRHEAGGSICI